MRFKLIFILLLGTTSVLFSQVKTTDVLFTVDNEPIMASEFLRVYNKNLSLVKDESQKDVDEYLKLFINYKLKLSEAKALEFDKKPKYIREFDGYKKQLAKNYLTDHKVTDALVKEAYDRVSHDVKASHILIRMTENETDTTKVYDQMLRFRERLMNEDFETLKKEVHNGTTIFVEDLGYFSAFKMVYAFENMAYNTPVGEISKPFRTQFGYHVMKVFDKRKSRGSVTVGHIMISNNKKDSVTEPSQRIQEIYKLIQQGENFESLAKQFSDDQSSAKKGGKLSTIKSGQLSSVKFENMAFSLKEIDEISEPFETDYGWHIAKLYEKKAIEPFSKLKAQLENRIQRDSRSKLINSAFVNKLKTKYNVNTKNVDLAYFVTILNNDYFAGTWKLPAGIQQEKPLFVIGNQEINYHEFAKHLEKGQKKFSEKQSFERIVKLKFNEFLDIKILKYHEDNLETENEEYANVLVEYRDGLLLFDLMEDKIWNAVKEDSIGLEAYYNKNKSKYVWPDRIDAVVVSGSQKQHVENARNELIQNASVDEIKAKINTEDKQNIIFTMGVMTDSHQALPKDFEFKKGVSIIYNYNNAYHVIQVNNILPSAIKTFDEAKGKIISDYQKQVEEQWLEDLGDKYNVIINNDILNKIKLKINN